MTLEQWATENPTINPFENCSNIETLGGAQLYWDELRYRYDQRTLYNPDRFVAAVERLFDYNHYKYQRLLATTTANYDMFENYKLQKAGSEKTTYGITQSHTGTDSYKKGAGGTVEDGITITTTTTPGIETTVTDTPGAKIKETITPQTTEVVEVENKHKIKETVEKGISKTTTSTPEGYTDSTSRTTYDDNTYKPVEQRVHSPDVLTPGEITEEYGDGQDVTTTEFLTDGQGRPLKDTTTTSYENGSKIETVIELLDDTANTSVTSKTGFDETSEAHSGVKTTRSFGQDDVVHGLSIGKTGDETLSFTDRADTGHMYREPQNAISDERRIAIFTILNIILGDVEAATLLSVY